MSILLNKIENTTLSKPFLAYNWPLKVIKAPFAYFNIGSKPSIDCIIGHFDFFCFILVKNPAHLYEVHIIFFCTMDGFSRIFEKKGGGLLCTRLYILYSPEKKQALRLLIQHFFQALRPYQRLHKGYFDVSLLHRTCVFKALRLFFLSNFPDPTLIPCPTSITDSRVM